MRGSVCCAERQADNPDPPQSTKMRSSFASPLYLFGMARVSGRQYSEWGAALTYACAKLTRCPYGSRRTMSIPLASINVNWAG